VSDRDDTHARPDQDAPEAAHGEPTHGEATHGEATPPPPSHDAQGEGEDGSEAGGQDEATILRDELATLRRQLEEAEGQRKEAEARALRAFAELDTVRRRAAGDQDRARDAGLDAAVLPVMTVYDDLRRALAAAEGSDPASIVPGVRAVMETLERNLEKLDIRRVGEVGDAFDPDQHEALTSAPLQEGAEPGTIADVFEAGFKRGDRLIRPARVVVYQDDA